MWNTMLAEHGSSIGLNIHLASSTTGACSTRGSCKTLGYSHNMRCMYVDMRTLSSAPAPVARSSCRNLVPAVLVPLTVTYRQVTAMLHGVLTLPCQPAAPRHAVACRNSLQEHCLASVPLLTICPAGQLAGTHFKQHQDTCRFTHYRATCTEAKPPA
jgi:hypothetical protein